VVTNSASWAVMAGALASARTVLFLAMGFLVVRLLNRCGARN
jgi:hypothetical protein